VREKFPVKEKALTETISAAELASELNNSLELRVIDVRSSSEFASGHIPGATNLPMDELEARSGDLRRVASIVFVCQGGVRASMARKLLADRGGNLRVLAGGTKSWIDSGLPVVASVKSRWSLERQVRLIAGTLVVMGAAFAVAGYANWIYLALIVGAGLVFAGLTDFCAMARLLALLPWNRPARSMVEAPTLAVGEACTIDRGKS
jgi:rhodanese-related sulfurtransferase